MITLEHICKSYTADGVCTPVLQDVSLHIPPGSFWAITGPSGSGKSTLMNLLGCLDQPDSGVYRLAGRAVPWQKLDALSAIRRSQIGFIFQNFQLIDRLQAWENVALPLLIAGGPLGQRRQRAQQLLRQVGLCDRVHHRPSQLSGGQQQRVAIARAMALEPPLLLADEPTGNLDRAAGQSVLELLQQLHQQGRTIVLITHDASVAHSAQHCITIEDGRCQNSGS